MQDLSFPESAADDRVRRILESSLEFLATIEEKILAHRQPVQGQVQARSFPAATAEWVERLRLDDQESTSGSGRASSRAREPNRITVSGLASRTIVSTISRIRLSSSLCIQNP